MLLILGGWRHLARHVPLRYDPQFWSMVFPIGMYTVATVVLAQETDLGVLFDVGHVLVYVALAARLVVFVGLLRQLPGCSDQPDSQRTWTNQGGREVTLACIEVGEIVSTAVSSGQSVDSSNKRRLADCRNWLRRASDNAYRLMPAQLDNPACRCK